MNILVMGGTRFVGKPLVERLQAEGHALTLFTRGNKPAPAGVEHLIGDRSTAGGLEPLVGRSFDVIVDSSGRSLEDSRAVIERTGPPAHRVVYVSSAGVYADSELWPLDENSPVDPASRHAGKAISVCKAGSGFDNKRHVLTSLARPATSCQYWRDCFRLRFYHSLRRFNNSAGRLEASI